MAALDLYRRFINGDDDGLLPKIPVQPFAASLAELTRGLMTQPEIQTAFAITASDQVSELTELIGNLGAGGSRVSPLEVLEVLSVAEYSGTVGQTINYRSPSQLRLRLVTRVRP